MNEMTLSPRHRNRNSGPYCCLMPSTLHLFHGGSPHCASEDDLKWLIKVTRKLYIVKTVSLKVSFKLFFRKISQFFRCKMVI